MHYLHHVPGRLRIRLPAIKRNANAAHALCAAIVQAPGVTAVEANILTGSVTVRYDPSTASFDALVDTLAATSHVDRARLALPAGSTGTTADAWRVVAEGVAHGGRVAIRTATSMLIDKFVERSAITLIGALL